MADEYFAVIQFVFYCYLQIPRVAGDGAEDLSLLEGIDTIVHPRDRKIIEDRNGI